MLKEAFLFRRTFDESPVPITARVVAVLALMIEGMVPCRGRTPRLDPRALGKDRSAVAVHLLYLSELGLKVSEIWLI